MNRSIVQSLHALNRVAIKNAHEDLHFYKHVAVGIEARPVITRIVKLIAQLVKNQKALNNIRNINDKSKINTLELEISHKIYAYNLINPNNLIRIVSFK